MFKRGFNVDHELSEDFRVGVWKECMEVSRGFQKGVIRVTRRFNGFPGVSGADS